MPHSFTLYDSYLKKTVEISNATVNIPNTITMYGCGPTVYHYQHIGNMRALWLPDTIVSMAKIAGWETQWVSNITDVGHLVSDGDIGEDKLEKGAKRENKKVEEIVDFYTKDFQQQCSALHIQLPTGILNPKATEYVQEQMILALTLLKDGKAYVTDDGIYLDFFTTQTFFNDNLDSVSDQLKYILEVQKRQQKGSNSQFTGREILDSEKKSANDFALWKFVSEESLQKWRFNEFDETEELMIEIMQTLDSSQYTLPNKAGSPGWHSECVCMISQISGNKQFSNAAANQRVAKQKTEYEIDIHTGGEDHIDVHHKNEIIQSEALGFKLSRYWVHNKFVMVDGGKMSKSLGNVYLVTGSKINTEFYSIEEKGFNPLAYRLMLMEHHYTEQLNFTWEKLQQSQTRLDNLKKDVAVIRAFSEQKKECVSGKLEIVESQKMILLQYLLDNLNTPKFVEKFQEMVQETLAEIHQKQTLNNRNLAAIEFWEREFLQLDLCVKFEDNVLKLATKRVDAKKEKNYQQSDELREQIKQSNWMIDDHSWGFSLWKK